MIDGLEQSFIKQTRFVSDASHELRTPIAVIQGYAKLLNRWGKNDPVVLQESIDSISAETDHMTELIKKLLFLARSDQNRLISEKKPLSLNTAAQEVVKEILVAAPQMHLEYTETAEVIINGDYSLIKQLLWIYAENSIKYTHVDGHIFIKVYTQNNKGYISFKDDGAGIAAEKLPYIFDRFYRVDESRNNTIPGNGLGLSIAKRIIEAHNGRVCVESTPNQGTCFITEFNIADQTEIH